MKKELLFALKEGDEQLIKHLHQSLKNYKPQTESSDVELHRLIYTSARREVCDDGCIDQILNACQRNNPALNVTGILIHSKDRFLQVLEGPFENITSLYNKIAQDDRHGGAIMRYNGPTASRYFSNWHMAYKDLSSSAINFKTDISEGDEHKVKAMIEGDLKSYTDDGMRVLRAFLSVD